MKTAQRRRFSLSYPVSLDVDTDKNGLTESLQSDIDLYKTPENIALERFIRELTEAAGGKDVPAGSRRFLNWEEARRMIDCGMAIGAHTHSHPMLSKLEPEEQHREMTQSRTILSEHLDIKADVLGLSVRHCKGLHEANPAPGPGGRLPRRILLLWRSERAGNNAALRPQAGPNCQAKPCPLPGPNGYLSAHRQFLALIAFLSSGSLSQFRLLPEIRHLQLL